MTITRDIINQGKSSNGGWSHAQVALFGETLTRGWIGRLIGKDVPEEKINMFIHLKNKHLV